MLCSPCLTPRPTTPSLRAPDGRAAAVARKRSRGKSGLHGNTVPVNGRRGRPQGKCHRKQTARPRAQARAMARVKRCGKSAPRPRQRGRQGKPHREQDRIGTAGRALARCGQGHFRPAIRVGRRRRVATRVPEEWLHTAARQGQNPAYRPSGTFSTYLSTRVARPFRAVAAPRRPQALATCKPLKSHHPLPHRSAR